MLRPLRTMNTAIKRISARNVHERLALRGPRDELRDLADMVDGLPERLDSAFDAQKRFERRSGLRAVVAVGAVQGAHRAGC